MGRVVTSTFELIEPSEAGRLDPPMQDWLRLPVADSCPDDKTHKYWGTKNPIGYFCVRYCKDCYTEFRGEVTRYDIQRITDALCGTPIRLGR